MTKVILATTQGKRGRPVKVFNSLRKKYNVSMLNPLIEEHATKRFGRIPSAAFRWPLYSMQIFATNTNILHFFDSPNFVAVPLLYKKCKFVFDYRSSFSEKLEAEFPGSAFVDFAWGVETKLAKRANVILAANDIWAEKIRHRYGRKVFVVPNYPQKSFLPVRNKWEIRGETKKPIVLFFGYFTYIVDFANLLRCARKMPECEFWLIGNGPLISWVQQNASPNVKFFGYVPYKEIPDYINACDVGIVPITPLFKPPISNDQDRLKVGELAAFRKPIVASGLAPSSQYLLVKPDELDKGIRKALSGDVSLPIPRYWEDYSEKVLFEAYAALE